MGDALAGVEARWYLFGAQAAIVHGAARLTADIDITVELIDRSPRELEAALIEAGFVSRIADVDTMVERARVLPVVHSASGVPVDVVLAGPGLEALFLERAEMLDVGGVMVPVARAEDLITMKVLAGRGKDLEDAFAIVLARRPNLDVAMIESTLNVLEKALDRRDLLVQFREIESRAKQRPSAER